MHYCFVAKILTDTVAFIGIYVDFRTIVVKVKKEKKLLCVCFMFILFSLFLSINYLYRTSPFPRPIICLCYSACHYVINGIPSSLSPPISIGNGVLGVPLEQEFPEAPMGGWAFMETFIDDVKLREFSSKVPSPSVSPWKKSSLVFNRTRNKVTA